MRKELTLEFSRDRKSMSVFCLSNKLNRSSSGAKMFIKVSSPPFTVEHDVVLRQRKRDMMSLPQHQGAPESVLERCSYIRLNGSARLPLSPAVREQLLSTVREWGSGRDTLRCLAMATRDTPPDIHTLNLENSAAFADYEVRMVMTVISDVDC